MNKIKILIADDHDIVRTGLRLMVENEEDWNVCAATATGREAVAAAETFQPDIAILDLTMPDLNGLEALRQLKRKAPRCEVLLFTASQSDEVVREAFEAGAKSVVLKTDASEHLRAALKSLVNRKPYFTTRASEILFTRFLEKDSIVQKQSSGGALTPRERETIQLVAEGKTNKEVANMLGISVKTAESHRAAIMRKLALKSVSALVRYAIRQHIIEP